MKVSILCPDALSLGRKELSHKRYLPSEQNQLLHESAKARSRNPHRWRGYVSIKKINVLSIVKLVTGGHEAFPERPFVLALCSAAPISRFAGCRPPPGRPPLKHPTVRHLAGTPMRSRYVGTKSPSLDDLWLPTVVERVIGNDESREALPTFCKETKSQKKAAERKHGDSPLLGIRRTGRRINAYALLQPRPQLMIVVYWACSVRTRCCSACPCGAFPKNTSRWLPPSLSHVKCFVQIETVIDNGIGIESGTNGENERTEYRDSGQNRERDRENECRSAVRRESVTRVDIGNTIESKIENRKEI
ncbi:hypothetical protein EVAR_7123_1 [Eumeta japonica]|uniref:Uncharacterized protein n=1 Tax=Eumeta variegata TaxID=151549 RepID=A0A4C1U6K2_EUMVA|nr:hypothetical protein EVAR_7123_1 [Eumeta japonica]